MSTLPMPANLDQRPHPEPHRPGAALILLLVGPACLTGSYKPDEVVTATETTFSSSTSSSTLPGQPTTTTEGTTPISSGSESGTDSDASNSSANPGVCGDGIIDPGEECDDGNQTPGDGCENDCTETLASCGNGIVDFNEECDDGNRTDGDECSNGCIAPRLVFVTTTVFTGNLGGLTGADAKCAVAAVDLGLPGTQWRAWLSDSTDSPSTRMDTTFTGNYKLVDGTSVAKGWNDLTDGSLDAAINLTETGNSLSLQSVWTNTRPDGTTADTGNHCTNWSAADNTLNAIRGSVAAIDVGWTANGSTHCETGYRLYCFEHITP